MGRRRGGGGTVGAHVTAPVSSRPSARKYSSAVNCTSAYVMSSPTVAESPTYSPAMPFRNAPVSASRGVAARPSCTRLLIMETGTRTDAHTTPVATDANCDAGSHGRLPALAALSAVETSSYVGM